MQQPCLNRLGTVVNTTSIKVGVSLLKHVGLVTIFFIPCTSIMSLILIFLNSLSNIADKEDVCNSFKNMCFNQWMHVSAAEVIELIREISNGKAAGMDGLSGESLKYANHILSVLLSICFTCMFKHCYLPIGMLNSVIVPLVKNKNGDLSDRIIIIIIIIYI